MRSKFPGRYRPSKDHFEKLWKNCLFSVDASLLLSLYHYSPAASAALLGVLSSVKDRIWIAYQAAKEYHDNRIEVIGKETKKYADVKNQFQGVLNQIKSKTQHPFLNDATVKELERVQKQVEAELETEKKKLEALVRTDSLLEKVADLFDGRVGDGFPDDKLTGIFKSGEARYKKLIPPGFEDRKKDGDDKYGDLVIWFEMLNKAKADKKPLVFLTNDAKKDWWLIHEDETLGPRPELIEEFLKETNQQFYIYHSEFFLKYAGDFLKQKVDDKVIEEVREKRVADEKESQATRGLLGFLRPSPRSRSFSTAELQEASRALRDLLSDTPTRRAEIAARILKQMKNSDPERLFAAAKRQAVDQNPETILAPAARLLSIDPEKALREAAARITQDSPEQKLQRAILKSEVKPTQAPKPPPGDGGDKPKTDPPKK